LNIKEGQIYTSKAKDSNFFQ